MADAGIYALCFADTCTSEVHPVINPVAPYRYLLPNMYLFNVVGSGLVWTSPAFVRSSAVPSSWSAWPFPPQTTVNRPPIAVGWKVLHNLQNSLRPL